MVVILFILQKYVRLNSFSQIKKIFILTNCIFFACSFSFLFSQEKNEVSAYINAKEFYIKHNDDKALNLFYDVCKMYEKKEKDYYYYQSVLYASRIFYEKGKYENALPLLGKIVSSGNNYDEADYYEALQKLLSSYNNLELYQKSVSVYNKLDITKINEKYLNRISYFVGLSYFNLGDYQKSKDLFLIAEKDDNVDFKKNVLNELSKTESLLKLEGFQNQAKKLPPFTVGCKTDDDVLAQVNSILELLNQLKNEVNSLKSSIASDLFNSINLQCRLYKGEYSTVQSIYKKIVNPSDRDIFYCSISLFEQQKYAESESLMQKVRQRNYDYEHELLKAEIYKSLNKTDEALSIFSDLYKRKILPSANCIDYAQLLFFAGNYDLCQTVCEQIDDSVSYYIKGLCSVNLRKWNEAENHMQKYVDLCSNSSFNVNAYFYLGYSQYQQNKNDKSYESFQNYLKSNEIKIHEYEANQFCAKIALISKDYNNAVIYVERMVEKSKGIDKNDAVLFACEIYSDANEYNKALAILQPYLNEKSIFGLKAIIKSAEIYEKQDNIKKADELYRKCSKDFTNESLAESAMYHCGEMFFTKQDYKTAVERFMSYLYVYPKGSYGDSAYYFAGECNLRLNEIDKSIIQNENLVKNYSESVYLYAAYKNLMNANYQKKNYSESLYYAQKMLKEFASESKKDNIQKMESILKKVQNGENIEIAEKYAEYEILGFNKTKEGRIVGTEIAILLNQNNQTKERAYNLAQSIYQNQKTETESEYIAENALIIGEYKNSIYENDEASTLFLKAAELFRKNNNSQKAAESLYSAVVSFVSSKKNIDAAETAALLKEIYPQSVQAKRVDALLR